MGRPPVRPFPYCQHGLIDQADLTVQAEDLVFTVSYQKATGFRGS